MFRLTNGSIREFPAGSATGGLSLDAMPAPEDLGPLGAHLVGDRGLGVGAAVMRAPLGERQQGLSDLKLASLRHDRQWVEVARDEALRLVGDGGQEVTTLVMAMPPFDPADEYFD